MATYTVKANDKEYTVEVVDDASGGATVTVEGRSFSVAPLSARTPAVQPKPASAAPPVAPAAPAPKAAPQKAAPAGSGTIVAPIPGVVTAILAKVGDQVSAGDIVLKLEAMKMENEIAAPVSGTVKEVAVSEGNDVSDGQLLMVIG